jgi:hypothetical protein
MPGHDSKGHDPPTPVMDVFIQNTAPPPFQAAGNICQSDPNPSGSIEPKSFPIGQFSWCDHQLRTSSNSPESEHVWILRTDKNPVCESMPPVTNHKAPLNISSNAFRSPKWSNVWREHVSCPSKGPFWDRFLVALLVFSYKWMCASRLLESFHC